MVTYDWNCRTVDVYPKLNEYSDVVYNVHYIVNGTDENNITGNMIGTQVLNTDNISDFKPFNELTNDEIVEWTKASLGEDTVAQIESAILDQIENKINPKSITLTIENENNRINTTGSGEIA